MKLPKILISFLFISLLAKAQTDSAIWKNDAKYTGNHTLTMNGFTQFMSGGTFNADTLKTKQLTVTDGSKTSVYGKNFLGTSSADDVQLFAFLCRPSRILQMQLQLHRIRQFGLGPAIRFQ